MPPEVYNPWIEKLPPRTKPLDPAACISLWPVWPMEGARRQADKDMLAGAMQERVESGEYNAEYQAYEIRFGKDRGSGRIMWTNRGHCPAAYRPILRALNCRIAWSLVALQAETDCALLGAYKRNGRGKWKGKGKGKGKEKEIRPDSPICDTIVEELDQLQQPDSSNLALTTERYALWRDGHYRNVFYHTRIRREFFTWLEKNYYGGKGAAGKRPVTIPMPPLRCDILEAWWKIEIVIHKHSPYAIHGFKRNKDNMAVWTLVGDVFEDGTSIYSFHYFSKRSPDLRLECIWRYPCVLWTTSEPR